MKKIELLDVAVIGGGIFGAEIALRAQSLGLTVKIYEAKSDLLKGASANNQNRLHLGFHYPRALSTGVQSILGFEDFKRKYAESIQGGFPNAYFIENEKSLTSPSEFLTFCKLLGQDYEPILSKDFPVSIIGADIGILCEEVVYDMSILRELVRSKLSEQKVCVELGTRVISINKTDDIFMVKLSNNNIVHANVIINAGYVDVNRLTEELGHPVSDSLFEYTAVPIIDIDIPKVGITIMDGPFMTLLPYGKTGSFLLYAVDNSVVAKKVSHQIDFKWLNPASAPFALMDKELFFNGMIDFCKKYVPALSGATLKGFLEGPRMVLAKKDSTDERPSAISNYGDSYFKVFSGKIDHCMWVADDMARMLKVRFNL